MYLFNIYSKIIYKTKLYFNNFYYSLKIRKLNIRHTLPSALTSLDDDLGAKKGVELIPLIIKCVDVAYGTFIKDNSCFEDSKYFNVFPGEHYRLLAGFTKIIKPKEILEIGTFTGMSSRVFLDYSKKDSHLHTFDIIDWKKFNSYLKIDDFNNNKVTQYLYDLSNKNNFKKFSYLINQADLFFLDGPKDGIFEYKLLERISKLKLENKKRILIIDDIRFLNMIPLWRSIKSPKLDLTSFGHWSGTGIVDISERLILN